MKLLPSLKQPWPWAWMGPLGAGAWGSFCGHVTQRALQLEEQMARSKKAQGQRRVARTSLECRVTGSVHTHWSVWFGTEKYNYANCIKVTTLFSFTFYCIHEHRERVTAQIWRLFLKACILKTWSSTCGAFVKWWIIRVPTSSID